MTRQYQITIGDANYTDHQGPTVVDGHRMGTGLVPRDLVAQPVGSLPGVRAFDGPLIPWEEFPERIEEMNARKMRLSDIRARCGPNGGRFPSLDQNGQGYCWNYSVTAAAMLARGKANLPYVRLSGHANAWMIKGGRDRGGWSPEAAARLASHGCPTVEYWPEKSMRGRVHNNPQTWANAAQHKMVEGWADLSLSIYDRNLTAQQVLTCLCQLNPVTLDLYWWGHSVVAMDPVDVYPNRSPRDPKRYGAVILNSWRDAWGDNGEALLKDSRWIPDGGVSVNTISLAA